ncbi:hypothetical protein PYK79_51020, partial [Streptomyces sp. ID05-04B]|nr:hypothetical protein [Streptomyces sp. ID05-04B]
LTPDEDGAAGAYAGQLAQSRRPTARPRAAQPRPVFVGREQADGRRGSRARWAAPGRRHDLTARGPRRAEARPEGPPPAREHPGGNGGQ